MPVSVHLFLVAGDIIIAVIAAAGADEHGLFNAQLFEERMHAGDQRLIGAQLLRIIKEQHAEIAGKVVHIASVFIPPLSSTSVCAPSFPAST